MTRNQDLQQSYNKQVINHLKRFKIYGSGNKLTNTNRFHDKIRNEKDELSKHHSFVSKTCIIPSTSRNA